MADDIVKRLRTVDVWDDAIGLMDKAADEIERLRAAGDQLAKVWSCYSCEEFSENHHTDDNGNTIPCPAETAYIAWQEARRG